MPVAEKLYQLNVALLNTRITHLLELIYYNKKKIVFIFMLFQLDTLSI